MRLPDGRLHPARALAGPGAKVGDALVWDGIQWKPGPVATAVLWVDVAANPPTDGSVFWYVTDETC